MGFELKDLSHGDLNSLLPERAHTLSCADLVEDYVDRDLSSHAGTVIHLQVVNLKLVQGFFSISK